MIGGVLDIDYLYSKGTTITYSVNLHDTELKNDDEKMVVFDKMQAILINNQSIFEHLNIHVLDDEMVSINSFKKFIKSLNFTT